MGKDGPLKMSLYLFYRTFNINNMNNSPNPGLPRDGRRSSPLDQVAFHVDGPGSIHFYHQGIPLRERRAVKSVKTLLSLLIDLPVSLEGVVPELLDPEPWLAARQAPGSLVPNLTNLNGKNLLQNVPSSLLFFFCFSLI